MKKQFSKPFWKRCFTFALAAALVLQITATPSLTAFAADETTSTISTSDLQSVETVSSEPQTEEPAAEDAVEDSSPAPEADLKAAPAEPEADNGVAYIDQNGVVQEYTGTYTVVTNNTTQWTSGWYVVNDNVTIKNRAAVQNNAEVHLILCDGITLTLNMGVTVTSSNKGKLTIYAQSTGSNMGSLVAKTQTKNNAPIGGYGKKTASSHAGTITINGGNITATADSGKYCAAIGGTNKGGAGTITINGGNVNATVTGTASSPFAAIGFGYNGNAQEGTVTINGGNVKATAPTNGSKGYAIAAKSVTINGGQVTANGNKGCGIGATNGTISLSYTNLTDKIYASSYSPNPTLEKEFILEGTDTLATPSNAGGNTIVPKPTPLTVYSITYDLDGGTVATANPAEYTVETETFTLNNPTKEGYVFIGWSGTGIEGTSTEVTIEKGSEGDRSYTANWEVATCTVTITESDGYEIKAIAVVEGDGESEGETTSVSNGSTVKYGAVLDVTVTTKPGYDLDSVVAQMGEEEINLTYVSSIKVKNDITISANVKIKHFSLETIKHDNGAAPVVSCSDYPTSAVPYGTEVEVTAGDPDEGYEFVGFYRSNNVLLEKNSTYTFTVNGNPDIEARYQKKLGNIVTFVSKGQIVATVALEADEAFTDDNFPKDPSAPNGYVFKEWDKTAAQINDALQDGNVTVEAVFELETNSFVVEIYNGESTTPDETVECTSNTIITRKAKNVEGKYFAYWQLGDEIISYNATVSFIAKGNSVLKAVYSSDAVAATGTATINTAKYNIETHKLTFNVYLTLPNSNCKILKAGLIAVSADSSFDPEEQELTDDLSIETGVIYKKALATVVGKSSPVDYTWNKTNVNPGDEWFVRARLSYTDENGNEQVIYGPTLKFTAGNDYDKAEKGTAIIRSVSDYDPQIKKATFNAYLAVPNENCKIVKAGLVAASNNTFDPLSEVLTDSNAEYVKSLASAVGKHAPVDYTWNKTNVNPGAEWYARAWLVYDDEFNVRHVVYGDLTYFKAE